MILSEKRNKKVRRVDLEAFEFEKSYDVIVAGLGTAGAIAAIVAAKRGLKVLGIEKLNCMGGIATAGTVTSYYFGSNGGYYEELDQQSIDFQKKAYSPIFGFHPDAKKYTLEQSALQSGVDLCYEAAITGVFLEGRTVKGVRWVSAGGVRNANCKILIDCTGDAEVCDIAGCKTYKGREFDGRNQPFTSVKAFLKEGKRTRTNFDCGCMDQTDAEELSDAVILSHAHQLEANYDKSERLLYLAPLIGIREGRRIEGEETLRFSEFLEGKVTEQPVFYAYADIDKHGRDTALESELLQDWYVASNLGAVNVCVPVPLGTMIPKGVDGLLAAGRCISQDHDLSTCVRMIRDMQKTGEAAAVAAALAIKNNTALKYISYDELKPLLEETGCFDEQNHVGFQIAVPGYKGMHEEIQWMTKTEQIRQGLSADRPGIAIWSARNMGDGIKSYAKAWLKENDCENLRKHSAIVLALLGEREALPVLREMVLTRDTFVLKDCRKNNQMRGYIAIYLSGKLRDVEMTDTLIDLICNPEEFERPLYHDLDLVDTRFIVEKYNEIYFQFFSNSIMALIKIGDRYETERPKIGAALKKAVETDAYIEKITQKKPGCYEYSMAENLRTVVEREVAKW